MADLNFPEACEYLSVSPATLTNLRLAGLVGCQNQEGRQIYPETGLRISRHLLQLGQERGWDNGTLACYADALLATQIGRAITLPIVEGKSERYEVALSWLETPYAAVIPRDLSHLENADGPLVSVLRTITAIAVGAHQFWPSETDLASSSLYPIIRNFEAQGILILGQGTSVARDADQDFGFMVLAFATVVPPMAVEFQNLARFYYGNYNHNPLDSVSPADRALIKRESGVAVDPLYASKATEIHSPAEAWDFDSGVLRTEKRTIALEMRLEPDTKQAIIDNIIDAVQPYLGVYGARVLRLLYETANDGPFWRTPLITVNTNDLLDRLQVQRDSRGFHRTQNRERLRDALNAAHNLEIVGEYTTWEDGKQVRKALRRTVLSLVGATFDVEENRELKTPELFIKGLPKSLNIRLNFFDSIRQPNGQLGRNYVLMPRLSTSGKLRSARHAATEEALKTYLFLRYRQTGSRELTITREIALERAGITNKNVTRQTQTLKKALDKLIADGTVISYSAIPRHPHESFTVTLAS